jgi:hypothetical protein
MRRLFVLAMLAATLVPGIPAAAAVQACGPSAALKRQNTALQRQVTKLSGKVATLTADLNVANEKLRIAADGTNRDDLDHESA